MIPELALAVERPHSLLPHARPSQESQNPHPHLMLQIMLTEQSHVSLQRAAHLVSIRSYGYQTKPFRISQGL